MGENGPGHAFVMTPNPDIDRVQLPCHIMGFGSEMSPITHDIQGPHRKWHRILSNLRMHAPACLKASLDCCRYLMQCACYVKSCHTILFRD